MRMANPATGFPRNAMPGEPTSYDSAPRAISGQVQPPSGTRAKTVNVKAHTRVIKPKVPKAPAPDPTTKALIDAAVRLKFGGQEQGINQQLQQNARFTSGAPSWYASAIQQIQSQAQQVPQSTMPAPTGDPATDSRNAAAYGFQQQRNNTLTAGNTFLTNVGAGLTAAEGNTLNAANANRQGLLSQQTQLKGNEGDFKATTLEGMQAAQAKADQTAEIENAKIQAAIYIQQGKTDAAMKVLQSLNQDRHAKNEIARSNADTQRGNLNETEQQHRVQNALDVNKLAEKSYKDSLTAKPKDKPIPLAVEHKAQHDFDRAQAVLRGFSHQREGLKHAHDPNGQADNLVVDYNIDRDLALAAAQMFENEGKGIQGIDDPRLAQRIKKRFGIKVPVAKQSPLIGHVVAGALGKLSK